MIYTDPYFKQMNTMSTAKKTEIEEILKPLPATEKIAILESLGKKYRRENSANINNRQMESKLKR